MFYYFVHPFYAITIDLDNILYTNYLVINQVEEKLIFTFKEISFCFIKN